MANDLAKMIVEYATNDKSLDGLELQKMFKRKIQIDGAELREQLKKLVQDTISTKSQPANTTIMLTPQHIRGAEASVTKFIKNAYMSPDVDPMYVHTDKTKDRIIVQNEDTKQLIRDAIIPLNLKWTVEYDNQLGYIIQVSWAHWDYE